MNALASLLIGCALAGAISITATVIASRILDWIDTHRDMASVDAANTRRALTAPTTENQK